MEAEKINLATLKPHPDNPRKITEEGLESLKSKIANLEKMLSVRRIVYDENNIIWGGNKRHEALTLLGYTEIPKQWTEQIIGWTEEEKKTFMLTDNISDGDWDREILHSDYWRDYDYGKLGDNTLKYIQEATDADFGEFFKDDDTQKDIDEKQKIVLEYTIDEYEMVKAELAKHGKTPEDAVFKLLGL